MPLNRNIIGKKYPSTTHIINERDSMFYALAYNEDNDAYFDKRRESGIIVPPMYAVRYMGESIDYVLKDESTGLNNTMMMHYAQEFEWLKPVKPGDRLTCIADITDILPGQFGEQLVCKVASARDNEEVANSKWVFLDRSSPSTDAEKERPKRISGDALYEQQMPVRNGQTWIYAHASGDFNPIHIDDRKAEEAGLEGIVLHGLCTMAFAHKACADQLGGEARDPMKVRKLSVQFARAVKPGDTVTFRIFGDDRYPEGKYDIKAVNQRNKDLFYNAWCLII